MAQGTNRGVAGGVGLRLGCGNGVFVAREWQSDEGSGWLIERGDIWWGERCRGETVVTCNLRRWTSGFFRRLDFVGLRTSFREARGTTGCCEDRMRVAVAEAYPTLALLHVLCAVLFVFILRTELQMVENNRESTPTEFYKRVSKFCSTSYTSYSAAIIVFPIFLKSREHVLLYVFPTQLFYRLFPCSALFTSVLRLCFSLRYLQRIVNWQKEHRRKQIKFNVSEHKIIARIYRSKNARCRALEKNAGVIIAVLEASKIQYST